MIKSLFSIEIENDISHSLNVKTLKLPAVSQQMADLKSCPEVSWKACENDDQFSFHLNYFSYASKQKLPNYWKKIKKHNRLHQSIMHLEEVYRLHHSIINVMHFRNQIHFNFQMKFDPAKVYFRASIVWSTLSYKYRNLKKKEIFFFVFAGRQKHLSSIWKIII